MVRQLLLCEATVPGARVGDAVHHEHRRAVRRAPRVQVQAAHPPRMLSSAADDHPGQTSLRLLDERSAMQPPIRAPAMPIRVVMMMPPGCLPGRIARAGQVPRSATACGAPVASYSVNDRGVAHAKRMIEARQYVLRS